MKDETSKKFKRKQPFFSFVKAVLRLFRRKPRILNLAGKLHEKCILLFNHSAKDGPLDLELHFPLYTVKWGAHEMLGKYASRRKYLKEVYYMQKCGFGRARAGFLATFAAMFSQFFYRGIKVIGTYQDARLLRSLNRSEEVLDTGGAIMIFPEKSDEGYFEEMTSFHPGFVLLARHHFKRTGEDLPVYPCYYHVKKRVIVVGNPECVNEMAASGMDKFQIAEHFKNRVNGLLHTYCV